LTTGSAKKLVKWTENHLFSSVNDAEVNEIMGFDETPEPIHQNGTPPVFAPTEGQYNTNNKLLWN
jgi:hypothetical protein